MIQRGRDIVNPLVVLSSKQDFVIVKLVNTPSLGFRRRARLQLFGRNVKKGNGVVYGEHDIHDFMKPNTPDDNTVPVTMTASVKGQHVCP